MPILPYREPEVINACSELGTVLKKEQINSVLVVTDKGIVNNGLVHPVEKALKESDVQYVLYDDTKPNPTVQNVEDALTHAVEAYIGRSTTKETRRWVFLTKLRV